MSAFGTLPTTQTDGTLIDETIYNDELITNILALINMTAGGDTLYSKGQSIEIGHDVGDIKPRWATSNSGNRWIMCDGRTIGSAGSGATSRANSDMFKLYEYLWNNSTNSVLVIQNSAGVGTTRGASALDDWNANKRLPMPDMRGRTLVGMDDPTGSNAANRITDSWADVLGGSGGSSTHTLTIAEMPSHNHVGAFSGSINFAVSGGVGAASGSGYGNDSIGNTGGGGAHANVQPSMAINYFMYAGN